MEYLISGVILVLLFLLLSAVWPPDSPWSPWWKVDDKISVSAARLANLKNGEIVYELGSGDGEFLLAIAKRYRVQGVGIEIDPLRFVIAKVRVLLSGRSGQITLIRKDFKKVDLLTADVVFMYLVPRAMERIYPKLKKELQPGTRVISYQYEIPKVQYIKQNKAQKLFLYTM